MKRQILGILISIPIFLGALVIAVLITAFVQRDSLTEIVCLPANDPQSYVRECMPNPFRDMGPELEAERHLGLLKSGHIAESLPYLKALSKEPEKFVGRENEISIDSWKLISRKVENDGRYSLGYTYRTPVGSENIIVFYFVRQREGPFLDLILAGW